jgi:replicative DNA helicase
MPDQKKERSYVTLQPERGVTEPAAIDTEKKVLGGMLISKEAVPKALELLKPEAFHLDKHSVIFEAMTNLFKSNEPVDTVTVYEELNRMEKVNEAGGAVYINELSMDISSAANIETYSRIVLEKAILRGLINASHEIAQKAYAAKDDVYKILDFGEQQIFKIGEEHLRRSFSTMETAVKYTLAYIQELHEGGGRKFAVPTGYYDLDDLLGGFQRSDLVIIAARPSMGKTALALSMARNAALDHNVPVAIFSLEMATTQLVMRLICAEGKLNAHQVRTGKLPEEEGSKLSLSATKLMKAPLYIDDMPAQSVLDIRAKSRRLKAEKNIGMIIIDYLQLMQPAQKEDSREREISSISRSLKALAKELNIPVIALAQLNRQVESRTDKRPILSDLRESGALEQDADVVMMINRPEKYGILQDSEGNSLENMAEVIVAKHRNGPVGDVQLRFVKDYARFENLEMFISGETVPPKQIDEGNPI